jgi:hypothetical protein
VTGSRTTTFRAHARRHLRAKATLLHQGQGWDRDAVVVDLGFGGACVEVGEALAQGDRVTLSLVAPNLWDPLLVSGQVAWVRPSRIDRGGGLAMTTAGVAFDLVHPTTLWAIFEMMGALDYDG